MVDFLARNWGWITFRGVVVLLFGLLTLLNPAITLVVLIIMFGAFALVDGVLMIISAVANRRQQPSWKSLLVSGILAVLIGIMTLMLPGVTAITLLLLIAAWAIVTGIAAIVVAIRLRKEIEGEWLFILHGILSVLFGTILIVFPGAGALAMVLWIGAFAVITGILLIAFSLRLRKWHKS